MKARLRLFESLRAGDALEGALLQARPEVRANVEAHRGFTLHHARVAWDIDGLLKGQGVGGIPEADRKEMVRVMKKLLGEARTMWFGTDGKVVVQVTAADWAAARRALDRYLGDKDPVGRQQAFREARRHLPAETTVLNLAEAGAYVRATGEFMQFMVRMRARDVPVAKLPPPPAPGDGPCYFGTALTLRPGRGSLDLWLSAEALGEFYKICDAIIKLEANSP